MNKLKLWWERIFKVIPVKRAQQLNLKWGRNVYGDEINRLDCRSLWFDKKGRSYRVEELFYPNGVENYFLQP